jgi:uncharacterized pyridoxamine 5'-phosphate oxidase family protein
MRYSKTGIILLCMILLVSVSGCGTGQTKTIEIKKTIETEEETMTNLEFFKSLNFENGIDVVTDIFRRFPLQYGTTLGLDGNPQIRPLEFKFQEDGVLYFDTVTFYTSYQELLAHPYIQICICDQETMTYLRVGGKVNFTDDREIVDRCFENSPVLTSQFGENRDVVIAYYLTEAWAEFTSFSEELPTRRYELTNIYDEKSE